MRTKIFLYVLALISFANNIHLAGQWCCPPDPEQTWSTSEDRFASTIKHLPEIDRKLFLAIDDFSMWNNGLQQITECIQNGANVNATTSKGENPLHILIEQSDKINNFNQAAYFKNFQLLLDAGCKVNAINHSAETALHMIYSVYRANAKVRRKIVKTLLENGADSCSRNADWRTCLHINVSHHLSETDAKHLLTHLGFATPKTKKESAVCKKRITTFFCCLNRLAKDQSCFYLPSEIRKKIISQSHEMHHQTMFKNCVLAADTDQWPAIINACPLSWTETTIKQLVSDGNRIKAQKLADCLSVLQIAKAKELVAMKDWAHEQAYDLYRARIQFEFGTGFMPEGRLASTGYLITWPSHNILNPANTNILEHQIRAKVNKLLATHNYEKNADGKPRLVIADADLDSSHQFSRSKPIVTSDANILSNVTKRDIKTIF